MLVAGGARGPQWLTPRRPSWRRRTPRRWPRAGRRCGGRATRSGRSGCPRGSFLLRPQPIRTPRVAPQTGPSPLRWPLHSRRRPPPRRRDPSRCQSRPGPSGPHPDRARTATVLHILLPRRAQHKADRGCSPPPRAPHRRNPSRARLTSFCRMSRFTSVQGRPLPSSSGVLSTAERSVAPTTAAVARALRRPECDADISATASRRVCILTS